MLEYVVNFISSLLLSTTAPMAIHTPDLAYGLTPLSPELPALQTKVVPCFCTFSMASFNVLLFVPPTEAFTKCMPSAIMYGNDFSIKLPVASFIV